MANKLDSKHKEHEVEATHQEQETKSECRHHWIIESANGPASMGVCKICGEIKEFSNTPPEFTLSSRRASDDAEPTGPSKDKSNAEGKAPTSE